MAFFPYNNTRLLLEEDVMDSVLTDDRIRLA